MRARAAVLVLALVAGCREPEDAAPIEAGPPEPIAVELAEVQRLATPETVQFTGTLYGVEEVALAAEVGGRVDSVHADLGDVVQPGAVLARIAPLDYELARDERARALAQQLAVLGLDALPDEGFDVESLPAVVAARLEHENAQRRYQRSLGLAEARTAAISDQALADLRTAADVAASELDVARLEAQAKLAEARTLEAQLRLAERRLEQTAVRAPAGDRAWSVAARRVAAGDWAREADVLFRLVDTDPLLLRGPLPQRHFGRVRAGQAVALRIDSSDAPFAGVVARVAPAIDAVTRSFVVEARIENPEGRLAPGAFAVAHVVTGERHALFAPRDTVASFAGVQRVFAVVDGVARERRVELGIERDGRVELIGDVAPGDQLVLSPPARVVDGSPVEPREPATRP